MIESSLFPVFLKLAGRKVVLVGGGVVAASKLRVLLTAGAHVTVVAPEIRPAMADTGVTLVRRRFRPTDLDGAWLVVAAAPAQVNREVTAAADARQLFVNAVDDPANATAYLGGVVRRAGLTLAISTDGRAPALAGLLREALDTVLPEDLERWVDAADLQRRVWRDRATPMTERRPLLLDALNRLYRRETAPVAPPSGLERTE